MSIQLTLPHKQVAISLNIVPSQPIDCTILKPIIVLSKKEVLIQQIKTKHQCNHLKRIRGAKFSNLSEEKINGTRHILSGDRCNTNCPNDTKYQCIDQSTGNKLYFCSKRHYEQYVELTQLREIEQNINFINPEPKVMHESTRLWLAEVEKEQEEPELKIEPKKLLKNNIVNNTGYGLLLDGCIPIRTQEQNDVDKLNKSISEESKINHKIAKLRAKSIRENNMTSMELQQKLEAKAAASETRAKSKYFINITKGSREFAMMTSKFTDSLYELGHSLTRYELNAMFETFYFAKRKELRPDLVVENESR